MSGRFPWPTKVWPIWWCALNADEPAPPQGYMEGRDPWVRRLYWWCRNPFHNLTWYIVGCNDRWSRVIMGDDANWREPYGVAWHMLFQAWPPFLCPYFSVRTKGGWEFYIGWRTNGEAGARPLWALLPIAVAGFALYWWA